MRIFSLLILIGIIALMFAGQSLYTSDLEKGEIRDIYNYTSNNVNWNSSIADSVSKSFNSNSELQQLDININRFGNILSSFVNFVGYSFTELLNWSVEYGYEHPEYDLKFFLDFLIKILWIFIILALIPLIIPLLALICIMFKGVIWLYKKIFKKEDD